MKIATKVTLIAVVLAAVCVIIALTRVWPGESDDVQAVPDPCGPRATVWEGSDWHMFHGGRGLLGRAPGVLGDSFELLWKFKTADQIKSSPVIVDNIVYVGSSDENMYAIDFETGNPMWKYQTSD
ncbi:MAG: PQQ-binding-like beta-propeller repeat protein, partial [Woeseiaceae bacterium]|nr:PQQ-binding-like beta-propeller repeat protein [Woeseiaceae bacterium]